MDENWMDSFALLRSSAGENFLLIQYFSQAIP